MIINHTHQFIFVHIPKAAGTSLTDALSGLTQYRDQEIGGSHAGRIVHDYYANRYGLKKRSTAVDIRNVMGQADWQGYFKFAVVRNPFDRLLSVYHFLKGWEGLIDIHRTTLNQYTSAQQFLESGIWADWAGPQNIFKPQTTWICEAGTNNFIVDFLGKTENLASDFQNIANRLGVSNQLDPLKTLNKSKRDPEEITWTDDVVELFQKHYHRDIQLLGYSDDPRAVL